MRAHDRIDDILKLVSGLAPVVQMQTNNIQRLSENVQETSTQVREHVAECRLVRQRNAEDKNENTDWKKWAITAGVAGGCYVAYDLFSHFVLHIH